MRIALATAADRPLIYRLRHEVYARELRQHAENPGGQLIDSFDACNEYILASTSEAGIIGFMSITPPGGGYSLEKYVPRAELPFPVDDALYEFRLLAVDPLARGGAAASLIVYAGMRWVEARGGRRIMAVGRVEVLPMYLKLGFQLHHRRVLAGEMLMELMSLEMERVPAVLRRYARVLDALEQSVDWQLGIPFRGGS